MVKTMLKKLEEKFKSLNPEDIIKQVVIFLLLSWITGYVILGIIFNFGNLIDKSPIDFMPDLLIKPYTVLAGMAVIAGLYLVTSNGIHFGKGIFSEGKNSDVEDSVLENSRFMTDKERNDIFPGFDYDKIKEQKADGVPVRAFMNKKGMLEVNYMKGAHSLVIGATGSGKTTTFINPMIQLLGANPSGSSMIISDPKGELFDLHSQLLKDNGYDVLLLNLRDTYESSRWNPLEPIWNAYQDYLATGTGIVLHKDSMADYSDLKVMDENAAPGEVWASWNGRAYSDIQHCSDDVAVAKQKIYDEMYEDLNDLVSGICPITNEKDPLWEKGARSIILATCLAMLEDSENPDLGMTKEKFNFFNVAKILTNSADEYKELKNYFEGRSQLSQAYTLSRQVLAAADQTMSSYMSITFDKLNIFNDRGICGLTSATDIHAEQFASRPTALFIKIPDEKDTRHGLAALFILSVYKALIKVASAREDLSLPRNIYFILDEFGNIPKIEKFDKMITVGRSRKIWFNMVIQSYSQLNNVYGETCADIVKSNCAMKMFIGSNDIGTCKEFSELCGNKTVRTTSSSTSLGSKEGDMSISSQVQSRPLIYPSELQKLNNKTSTGNAVIVTFGNHPLKTKFTPSYQCPFYQIGRMDTSDIRAHIFRAEEVFYDVAARNKAVLG
ncbi:MAG: type IV secretory system conjugative DNA transfer family protein [Clostridia bacterium]|nr:type IV secretory system conjugative DNA transfer family protein [Clostridia bacterium]